MESFTTDRRATCSRRGCGVQGRVRGLRGNSGDAQSLAVKPQLPLQWGLQTNLSENGAPLAKPNYQYQKRQKELEKKKKQEEKRKRKLDSKAESEPDANPEAPVAGEETPPA
jgi:hypothetical protein